MKLLLSMLLFVGIVFSAEKTSTYDVKGMMCGNGCVKKINRALNTLEGIKSKDVNFETSSMVVVYDDKLVSDKMIVESNVEPEVKTYIEPEVESFNENHNKIYNLRLFGVFGELDNWRYRFIPNICVKAIFDLDLVINQNALFDFTYVNDICEVTNKFITNTYPNGDYNLCSSRALELICN